MGSMPPITSTTTSMSSPATRPAASVVSSSAGSPGAGPGAARRPPPVPAARRPARRARRPARSAAGPPGSRPRRHRARPPAPRRRYRDRVIGAARSGDVAEHPERVDQQRDDHDDRGDGDRHGQPRGRSGLIRVITMSTPARTSSTTPGTSDGGLTATARAADRGQPIRDRSSRTGHRVSRSIRSSSVSRRSSSPAVAVDHRDHRRARHPVVVAGHCVAVRAGRGDREQVADGQVGRQVAVAHHDVAALAVLPDHPGQHRRARRSDRDARATV